MQYIWVDNILKNRTNRMIKKCIGINRSKLQQFQSAKINTMKRKNRFKNTKDEELDISQSPQTNSLITSTTQNSSGQESEGANKVLEVYEQAKDNISSAGQYKKRIAAECKLRITVFKESEAKKHDQNICSYSKKAIEHLLKAEKSLCAIRQLKSFSESEQKYYRNMEKSLAQQLREMSKELRMQEKEHFDRLKAYEAGTANTAIELSETQKEKMRSDVTFDEDSSMQMVESWQQHSRDSQITELVKSINTLSTLYKQLNELVIEQGSIIDRIDYNIEETFTHVQAGNKHLRSAEDKASSPCAEKCMLVLIAIIFVLALILGFKYSK